MDKYPKVGSRIELKTGIGKVTEVNVLRNYVIVEVREEKDIVKKIKIPEEELKKYRVIRKNNSTNKRCNKKGL